MEDKSRIDKICITIGKKKLELGLEEAKELKLILNDLFGKEKELEFIPYYPTPAVPCPLPHYPDYPIYPTITYSGTGKWEDGTNCQITTNTN